MIDIQPGQLYQLRAGETALMGELHNCPFTIGGVEHWHWWWSGWLVSDGAHWEWTLEGRTSPPVRRGMDGECYEHDRDIIGGYDD